MKFIKQKHIAYIFLLTIVLFNCNNNPLTNKNKKQIKLEIISSREISINWDSTVYQHNTNWNSYLDTTAYNSLGNLLNNSEILIEDMWCPDKDMNCKIPYIPGMEVIVKLNKSNN